MPQGERLPLAVAVLALSSYARVVSPLLIAPTSRDSAPCVAHHVPRLHSREVLCKPFHALTTRLRGGGPKKAPKSKKQAQDKVTGPFTPPRERNTV
jgi:hypothetical protein